jgi:hypothetical protein
MDNRILHVDVRDHVLAPAAAEVHIVVRVAARTPSTQLRGRLMGPTCPFASTVEVAYPVRPLPRPVPRAPDELVARVVIPEASLWDTQSPFLYKGPVELWEGERRCDVVSVRHGLRLLRFGPRGLAINGRPLAVRWREMTAACSDDEALRLRQAGYNLLVAPVTEATVPLWDVADRFGFLVAGRPAVIDSSTLDLIAALRCHPSCLGWLASERDVPGERIITPDMERVFTPDILGLFGPAE